MSKMKSVNLELATNEMLDEISTSRRSDGVLAWRKKDIIAELVLKAHKREFK